MNTDIESTVDGVTCCTACLLGVEALVEVVFSTSGKEVLSGAVDTQTLDVSLGCPLLGEGIAEDEVLEAKVSAATHPERREHIVRKRSIGVVEEQGVIGVGIVFSPGVAKLMSVDSRTAYKRTCATTGVSHVALANALEEDT